MMAKKLTNTKVKIGANVILLEALTKFMQGGAVVVPLNDGTVTISGNLYYKGYADVVFLKKFETVPEVFLTEASSGPFFSKSSVTDVTTTGFRVHLNRINSSATKVNWLATTL